MAATSVHVSIAIYRGEPLDYQKHRHTSLFFRFGDGSPATLAHVVGPTGGFEFATREGYDPAQSETLADLAEVGMLSVPSSRTQVVQLLRSVPVRKDREFNCQLWVEAALKKLQDLGMLANDLYEKGLDSMVDAIAEAKHDLT